MGEMNDEPSKGADMETLFGNRWSEMGFQHDTYGNSPLGNRWSTKRYSDDSVGMANNKGPLISILFFVSGSQLNLQHHMFFVFGRSTNIPLPSGLYSCPEGWWVVIWDGPRYGKPWIIDSEQQKNPWLWDVIVIMDGKLFNWQKTTRIPQNILEEPHQKWWLGAAKQSHKDHVSVKFVTYKHL